VVVKPEAGLNAQLFFGGVLMTPSVSREIGTDNSSVSMVRTRVTRRLLSSPMPEEVSHSIQSSIRNGRSVKMNTSATKFFYVSCIAKPMARVAPAAMVGSESESCRSLRNQRRPPEPQIRPSQW
jgi:hypothetical protein